MLELRHLRYFQAVARTCHFGRAAEDLHIAQPALSQAIRQLEAILGAELLIRTTRQARLTPAGELFEREASRILSEIDAMVDGVRRVASGRLGVLRLGLTGTAAVSHLPVIARAVHERLPDVSFDIHADLLTPAQCDRLRDGTLDLGVLRPPITGCGVTTRTITIEPLKLALPTDHPLCSAEHITMADLRGEPFVMFDQPNSAVNHAIVSSCESAGFAPQVVQGAPDAPVMLSLVAAGIGIAFVPDGPGRDVPGVVLRDVIGADQVQAVLAWRTDQLTPVAAAVLAALEDADLFADQRAGRLNPT